MGVVFQSDLDKEFPVDGYDGRPPGPDDWFWCLHCERVYQVKMARQEDADLFLGVVWMCHYPDCDGDCFCDAWPWLRIRDYHPDYPEVPEVGKRYLL